MTLNWGCFACGRYHSHSSLTLRLRQDELQNIGFDHTYADRVYAAVFTCSVNLITGDAEIVADDLERITLRNSPRVQSLSDLNFRTKPEACDRLSRYDDAFMEDHFGYKLD